MTRRRRSWRERYFCCDKSSFEDSYPPSWPRASSPRRIMATETTSEINIFPNDRNFRVESCLPARIDKKITGHLLSKHAVKSQGNPPMEYPQQRRITDSSGRVYDCIGIVSATWRVEGHHSSELDDFIVAHGDFPDGVDVLMANSDKIRRSLRSTSKGNVVLPLFGPSKNKKEDKKDREKIDKRQQDEEDADAEKKRKELSDLRSQNSNYVPPKPTS